MCTGRERFLWGIGGRSNLSRSQHTLFKHGHHLRFRSASLDSATSSELSLSVSIPSISSSCCSFVSLPSYHLLSHTHPYSSLPLLHLSLYIVFSPPLSHKISPSTSHTSFAFSIPPPRPLHIPPPPPPHSKTLTLRSQYSALQIHLRLKQIYKLIFLHTPPTQSHLAPLYAPHNHTPAPSKPSPLFPPSPPPYTPPPTNISPPHLPPSRFPLYKKSKKSNNREATKYRASA